MMGGFTQAPKAARIGGELSRGSMGHLDLRGRTWSQLSDNEVARFPTKKEASTFAKSNGWLVKDVSKAADRFFVYWVICAMQSTETLTFLRKDGGTVEIAHPGYW